MALIVCRECGNQVSDMAAACPKCGAPVQKGNEHKGEDNRVNTRAEDNKMALIVCRECGNQVSDMATACPKCGAPVQKMMNRFCGHCGSKMPIQTNVCPKCGSVTPSPVSSTPPEAVPPSPMEHYYPQPDNSRPADTPAYDPDPNSFGHSFTGTLTALALLTYMLIFTYMPSIIYDTIYADSTYMSIKDFMETAVFHQSNSGIDPLLFLFLLFLSPLILISIAEFLAPRKTDPKYLVKIRRGWIVLCVTAAILLSFKFYLLGTVAGEYRFYYSCGFLFYLGLAILFGIIIESVAMAVVFSILKNRQDNILPRR